MQDVVTEILAKRRDRSIAVLLGMKEREVDQYLPTEVRQRLRKIILDQLNEMHSFVIDVVSSLDTGDVVVNDLYMQKLDEIHSAVVHNGHRALT